MKAYYTKVVRPDLTTIVVTGNVSPATARTVVEREFSNWHATGDAPDVKLQPLPLNPPGDVHLSLPVGQDSVTFKQIVDVPTQGAPSIFAAARQCDLRRRFAWEPDQSRLFRDLRQNAGLVYSIGSRLAARRGHYELSIDFACLPANQPRISSLIESEITRMQTQPVGAFELALAKASLVRQTVTADSSLGSIGSALLDDAMDDLPFDERRLDAQKLLQTDAGAIQSAFADYIRPQNFVRIVEGP